MKVTVSVVVPTFKRPDLLERCLAALVAQNFDPRLYEIIIVDDANSPEARQQVERWARQIWSNRHYICYLPITGIAHGPATARNLGWQTAQGEIIAFTDDDCIPDTNWLKAGVTAFTGDIAAVTGRVVVPLTNIPTDYEYNTAQLEQCEFATANCFYRRETLAKVGGFDERFTSAWREDSDLFFTLLEQKAPYSAAPNAIVVHPVRPARWGISLRQQRKSMFNALLYKKHPRLYREKVQATPPWHYYAIVGSLLFALVSTMKHSRFLTFCGFALWAFLTGRFCLQRLQATSHAPGHVVEMLVTSLAIPPVAIAWRLRGAIKFRVFFF